MALKDFFNFFLLPFKALLGDPNTARILRDGRQAVAKIISLGEAGPGMITVNDNPYVKFDLEVYDDTKDPYRTELKMVISRLSVAQFPIGSMVNIKIDPLDPMKVVFDTSGQARERVAVGNTEQKDIVNGTKGVAEIISIKKTDKEKNDQPVYEISYEITPEGAEKYPLTKETPLPDYALEYLSVGKKYECEIDKEDKTRVKLDVKFNK